MTTSPAKLRKATMPKLKPSHPKRAANTPPTKIDAPKIL